MTNTKRQRLEKAGLLEPVLSRKFTPALLDITVEKDKVKRRFQNKHLKAYLAGNRQFQFGYKILSNGSKEPMWYLVEQEFFYLE